MGMTTIGVVRAICTAGFGFQKGGIGDQSPAAS
jgi:hypothetical protein